ncbi:MAG: response regulator [Polyangia bacterium]
MSSSPPSSRSLPPAPSSIRRVLLVDDEPDVRLVARLSLERIGNWKVAVASSGVEALQLLQGELPDVILLDVMMPEMDGPTTLQQLRGQPRTAAIPVIFFTAKSQPQDIARFLGLGARGVITKPVDPLQLPGLIRRLMAESPR